MLDIRLHTSMAERKTLEILIQLMNARSVKIANLTPLRRLILGKQPFAKQASVTDV